jgi:hypothetical protein
MARVHVARVADTAAPFLLRNRCYAVTLLPAARRAAKPKMTIDNNHEKIDDIDVRATCLPSLSFSLSLSLSLSLFLSLSLSFFGLYFLAPPSHLTPAFRWRIYSSSGSAHVEHGKPTYVKIRSRIYRLDDRTLMVPSTYPAVGNRSEMLINDGLTGYASTKHLANI